MIGRFRVAFLSFIVAVNCFGKTVSLLGVAFRRFTAAFCYFCVAGFRFSAAFFDFAVPFSSFRKAVAALDVAGRWFSRAVAQLINERFRFSGRGDPVM